MAGIYESRSDIYEYENDGCGNVTFFCELGAKIRNGKLYLGEDEVYAQTPEAIELENAANVLYSLARLARRTEKCQ